MIEFSGYITGNAEKFFWKKSRSMVQIVFNVSWLILLPVIIFFAFQKEFIQLLVGYGVVLALINLLMLLPKTQKEKIACTPTRIYLENDCICYVTGKGKDFRYIKDVKLVRDYGDFYDIVFPFGKMSEYFVCQKNLLSKGTLEEFEALFEGKLERAYNGDNSTKF